MFDHPFHLPAMVQNALIAESDITLGTALEEFIYSIYVNWASDEYWASRTSTGARPGNSLRRTVAHPEWILHYPPHGTQQFVYLNLRPLHPAITLHLLLPRPTYPCLTISLFLRQLMPSRPMCTCPLHLNGNFWIRHRFPWRLLGTPLHRLHLLSQTPIDLFPLNKFL